MCGYHFSWEASFEPNLQAQSQSAKSRNQILKSAEIIVSWGENNAVPRVFVFSGKRMIWL